MGTNYYLRSPACSQCGHVPAELHIGKSSAGWNFGLRIYPLIAGEQDERLSGFGVAAITELDDWRPLFERFSIVDEYDRMISATEMIEVITERSHPRGLASRLTAEPELMGPYRSNAQDTYPGKGTYDLCRYEFS